MEDLREFFKPLQREWAAKVRIKEKWIRVGFTILPNALLLDRRISAQAKTIFAILCLHAFNKEEAHLSYELIQAEVGLSRPQVARYLRELKQTKLIGVIRTGRANKYEIVFAELDKRVDQVIADHRHLKQRLARHDRTSEMI